jgi:hypothetical protein
MWRFEGIWSRFQGLAIWVLVFKNNHKLSKISHLKIFARVPLENGVRCGAFDAQSRCISRLFYLIFQHFNIGNEFVNQGQHKCTWTQQCYLLALKHGPRSLWSLQVSWSKTAVHDEGNKPKWLNQRDNARTCTEATECGNRHLLWVVGGSSLEQKFTTEGWSCKSNYRQLLQPTEIKNITQWRRSKQLRLLQ